MKNLLPFVAGMMISTGVLANDPVIQQINITSDAVKVALEEFSQGKMAAPDSYDAKMKQEKFNHDATKALLKFEQDVRTKVLQSLSVLVSQYNSTYENKSLNLTAKNEILKNLMSQMDGLAKDKSQIYRQAYMELYSVLPEMPLFYDYVPGWENYTPYLWQSYESHKSNLGCVGFISGGCDKDYSFTYTGMVYTTKGVIKQLKPVVIHTEGWRPGSIDANELLLKAGFPTNSEIKTLVLEGCYTSACYFTNQAQIAVWRSMVESSLARDIRIPLNDGKEIRITKNVSRNGGAANVLDGYLNSIKTEGLINNLPYEATEERVKILSQMNDLIAKGQCSKAKKLKERLCNETRESCMQPTEVALFKDRFDKKAACL